MSRWLSSFPSLQDLLDSEPLRAATARLNPSAVVAGVRSFLGLLEREVRDAAAERRLPQPAELARQIADWLLAEGAPQLRPAINATGIVLHPQLGPPPLADEALHAVRAVASGACRYASEEPPPRTFTFAEALAAAVRRSIAAEGSFAAANFPAALLATVAAIAAGKEVLIPRGHLVDDGDGVDIAQIIESAGARVAEVGAVNRATRADFERRASSSTGMILHVRTRVAGRRSGADPTSMAELVELARALKAPIVDAFSGGALLPLELPGLNLGGSVQESIAAGADLVVFRADDLIGGPTAGVVAGARRWITPIASHPLAATSAAPPLVVAPLIATLGLYADPARARRRIPLLDLLFTSLDNLKNRAERMAPQLAAVEGIATAEPVELTATLHSGGPDSSPGGNSLSGYGVAVRPTHGTASELQTRLLASSPVAVHGAVQGERLVLNLRSVPARQDLDLVLAFETLAERPPTA